ncbi:MAG: CBS domain-containing protein [Anaerolineae bacterium]|nr:CBS domain-containing protein [Anaerolineae bacterium]
MLVQDRMTLKPVTVSPETTHRQAAEILREQNIHHLPVVDNNGKLVGIVVEEDLLAAQPSPATTLSIYEIHGLLSRLKLKDIMTRPVYTTTPDCPLEEAARLMFTNDIGCLPVVEDNQVVGIITDTDIFESLAELLGGGKEGARFTLYLPNRPGALAQVAQTVADAGGNIVSAATWHCKTDDKAYITIKEQGANYAALKQALDDLPDVDVIDIREKPQAQ